MYKEKSPEQCAREQRCLDAVVWWYKVMTNTSSAASVVAYVTTRLLEDTQPVYQDRL